MMTSDTLYLAVLTQPAPAEAPYIDRFPIPLERGSAMEWLAGYSLRPMVGLRIRGVDGEASIFD